MIVRVSGTVVAALLVIVGLIVLPLPLPLGAISILLGVGLAITVNPSVKRQVMHYRHTYPRLEAVIQRFQSYLPGFLRKPIHDSAPRTPAKADEGTGKHVNDTAN